MLAEIHQCEQRISYWDPSALKKGYELDFRLIYRGPLKAETSQSNPKQKHAIRKQLHPQLRELWGSGSV